MTCDNDSDSSSRFTVLCYEQVQRLHEFMEKEIGIHASAGLPVVRLTLKDFVRSVRLRLEEAGVAVKDVRVNGGCATHIIGMDKSLCYNDLDLLFSVDLSGGTAVTETIRRVVLNCLGSQLPASGGGGSGSAMEAYVRKLVRVQNNDSWFLLSLGDSAADGGLAVELKFVDRMRRKFEFTVDSFQLILDSLLAFYDLRRNAEGSIGEHFYPTVVAEAVSGSFAEAYRHLRRRQICTTRPEEIRGGGLLKYCKLIVDGFATPPDSDVMQLEKYMCSRFFIDFPDLRQQRDKVCAYLESHFPFDLQQRVQYLHVLHTVVHSSTVCLMQQERRSTLLLLTDLLLLLLLLELAASDGPTLPPVLRVTAF